MISASGKLSVKTGHLSTGRCQELLQTNYLIVGFAFILLFLSNGFSCIPLLEKLGEGKLIVPYNFP